MIMLDHLPVSPHQAERGARWAPQVTGVRRDRWATPCPPSPLPFIHSHHGNDIGGRRFRDVGLTLQLEGILSMFLSLQKLWKER